MPRLPGEAAPESFLKEYRVDQNSGELKGIRQPESISTKSLEKNVNPDALELQKVREQIKNMTLESGNNPEQLADKIEKLPHLKDGYVRLVHITNSDNVDNIVSQGLDYSKHGLLRSTVRSFSKESDVDYYTTDPVYNKPGMKIVVFDIPAQEYRKHDSTTLAPGKIPPGYAVGVVDAYKRIVNKE